MSKPGPRPRPNSVKKIAGLRRVNHDEPIYKISGVKKPRGRLGKAANYAWDKLAPEFQRAGVLTDVDVIAFELLCDSFGQAVEALGITKIEGKQYSDDHGHPCKHPMNQVWKDNAQLTLRFLSEFGGTPSSRSSLKGLLEDDKSLYELLWEGVEKGDQVSKPGGAIDQAEKGEDSE